MSLYFRIKDNGATVFRVEDENRQRRMELQPIAEANLRNGDIKPRRDAVITPAEKDEIRAWLSARKDVMAAREVADIRLTVERMNAAANWLSGKPDPTAAAALSDELLLAMHDLRTAIVRLKSKSLSDDD